MMNELRKSDDFVVPEKHPNKDSVRSRSAEGVEGRISTKRNLREQNKRRTQSRGSLKQALDRIRQLAKADRKCQFTSLWHHVYNVENLEAAFYSLDKEAARGIDGVSWTQYKEDLSTHLEELSDRLGRGAYRAKPVKRVYIQKAGGGKRPLGIPCLEDKIVQRATKEVLNAIYEVDFLGFSYGFRRGRKQHDALDALAVGLERKKVNWVLDADVQGFFDTIDHEWLCKFVEHRIADKRVLRHIKKWLLAGISENGMVKKAKRGTPQGSVISPLLGNLYLHYVFDLWANNWREKRSRGDVIIIRYADDFVVGFQSKVDAESFRADLEKRFKEFGLTLHPEKTRLIEFGRYAASNRKKKGKPRPESFDFLGFTHICGKDRKGRFQIKRKTQSKRFRRKLQEIKAELRERRHWKISKVGKWLGSVLRGHYQYYGVPLNFVALDKFRFEILQSWRKALRWRSQRHRSNWDRMNLLAEQWLPKAAIKHAWPSQRLHV